MRTNVGDESVRGAGLSLTLLLALLTLVGTQGAPPWINPEEPDPAPGTDVPWLNLTDAQIEQLEDLGVEVRYFHGEPAVRVRFARINAPEIFHPSSQEEYERGLKAKEFVEEQIRDAGGYVRCRAYGLGKYRRIIADVYPDDEDRTLSEMLVERGLAEYRRYPKPDPLPRWFPREFKARVAKVVDGDTVYVYLRNEGTPVSETSSKTSSEETENVTQLPVGRYKTGTPVVSGTLAAAMAVIGLGLLVSRR